MMTDKKLLIIDDEENMRHMLSSLLARYDYLITTAENGSEALSIVKNTQFDFILCDVKMPVLDGISFLNQAASCIQDSTVIMMSAFGNIDLALEAMQAGAYDFISKPFKTDEVLLTLRKAEEREQLRLENRQLRQQIAAIAGKADFPDMIAMSRNMKQVFELAEKVAPFDTSVLITGESGTGKELIARGIHERSARKNRNFVAVNCGSLPENLLESELFGHVRGAFTGADKPSRGLFREADGGTLLLDEIAELPLPMQVKLLRILQESEVRPVGASQSFRVNVRVLSATSKDLEEQVETGEFREDLFYRLNVVRIRIPPLRERKSDIDHLCHHFINKFNNEFGKEVVGFTKEALQLLRVYDWPGNVRELENVVQRGLVMADGAYLDSKNLPVALQIFREQSDEDQDSERVVISLKKAQKNLERKLISKALDMVSGNKSKASKLLEISYPSLLAKIKEYKID